MICKQGNDAIRWYFGLIISGICASIVGFLLNLIPKHKVPWLYDSIKLRRIDDVNDLWSRRRVSFMAENEVNVIDKDYESDDKVNKKCVNEVELEDDDESFDEAVQNEFEVKEFLKMKSKAKRDKFLAKYVLNANYLKMC